MNQQSKQTHSHQTPFLTFAIKLSIPLWKQIKGKATQEDNESFIRALKEVGMPEEKIPELQALLDSFRKANDDRKENYRSDKIFVLGISALNLILFQILASVGKPDIASYLSWATFTISLPCAAGFLYISSLQDRNEGYSYSIVHERLALVSVTAGALSAIALVWHFWTVAGVILLITTLIIYVICAFFKMFMNDEFLKTFRMVLNQIAAGSQEKETNDLTAP